MSNQVEIDVILTGAEEASRGLKGIGETAGQMAERFTDENSKLGEGLGEIAGSVEGLVGSFKEFGEVATTVGSGSKMSMLALVPALGAVVGAGYALYETFINISGAAEEAETRTEAMAAAASDLESKLEALAEKGVVPAQKALDDFIRSNLRAQFSKEILQKQVEKLKNEFTKLLEAEENVEKARTGQAGFGTVLEAGARGVSGVKIAQEDLNKATAAYNKKLESVINAHKRVLPLLDTSAKKEKALEENSAESTLARVKENIALVHTLELRKAEIDLAGTQLKVRQIEINAAKESTLVRVRENEEDAKALKIIEDNLKARIAEFNQLDQLNRLTEVRKRNAEASENKAAQRSTQRVNNKRIREMAIERQRQADLKKLRQIELQELMLNGASALQIAQERYNDELAAAGKNQLQQKIALKRFELEKRRIRLAAGAQTDRDNAERARRDEERFAHAQRLAFESLQFDLEMQTQKASIVDELPLFGRLGELQAQTDQEIKVLSMRYDLEKQVNAQTQEEITELTRRETAERTKINADATRAQINLVGEFASQYAGGLAEAAYNNLLFGESFSESVGEILIALGRQASIEALMQFAKGTAALFLPAGQAIAAGHFKAGGMFLAAAGAAGAAGKSLGGGGGGASAGASPSGSPSVAPTPQREEAESAPMVFNVNFSGAVIYDTKRSAEQALADRITSLQNTRRRGAARRV